MAKRIRITGGVGFIGSHLADELLNRGYTLRAPDNLSEQVHGPLRQRPAYLDRDVELIVGDVRDPNMAREALQDVDAEAAMVGVGHSVCEVARYTGVNNLGTAVLLEALTAKPVETECSVLVLPQPGSRAIMRDGFQGVRGRRHET